MNSLSFSFIQNFEEQGIAFTGRIWDDLGQAVLDSFFFSLGAMRRSRFLNLQFIIKIIELCDQTELQIIRKYLKFLSEYSQDLNSSMDEVLFDIINQEDYIEEIRTLRRSFSDIPNISKELNIKVIVFTVDQRPEVISYENFFFALNLCVFSHQQGDFEALLKNSDDLEELGEGTPACLEPLISAVNHFMVNKSLLKGMSFEVLNDLLNKIEMMKNRYAIQINKKFLELILPAPSFVDKEFEGYDSREQPYVLNSMEDLERLIGEQIVFCGQQFVPYDLEITKFF